VRNVVSSDDARRAAEAVGSVEREALLEGSRTMTVYVLVDICPDIRNLGWCIANHGAIFQMKLVQEEVNVATKGVLVGVDCGSAAK
jgi:hypothetical protein